jgi:hypothetical protein
VPGRAAGIARPIEQISGDHLALNQGTLSPALLKLEQAGWIRSSWGESDSGCSCIGNFGHDLLKQAAGFTIDLTTMTLVLR